jgi:hypothetical protein
MLPPLLLLLAGCRLAPLTAPIGRPVALSDTSQVFVGVLNQRYAWGTAMLRSGKVLHAYLPAGGAGTEGMVAYYLNPPAATPGRRARPQLLPVQEVQWLRVQGQYSELLKASPGDNVFLATRRAAGELELFVVQYVPPVVVNLLGSTPVLSSPASAKASQGTTTWYLRRAPAAAVLIEPQRFASQVPAFLAKDPELARRVAAREPGYGPADLEKLVHQYNQRAQ